MKLLNTCILGVCLLVPSLFAQPPIHLKAGTASYRPSRVLPGPARATHFLVQFASEPGADTRLELERRGMRVLQYVPDSAWLVASPVTPDLAGLPVLSAAPMGPADKISPLLADEVAGPLLVEFYPDVDLGKAREGLRASGFDVLENSAMLAGHLVVSGSHEAIGALAEWDDVAYVMPASADLAAGIPLAGCAGATTQAGPVGQYVLMGRGWPKDGSGNVALHYFVRSLTDKMAPAAALSEIERALREWTRYANFTLTATQQSGAGRTLDILFAHGSHGDGYPFDGAGGAVAHTFYPSSTNPEPIAGDLHLDADEAWHSGVDVDLYSVALHEAGHALGLGHSDRPGSVMYPYYKLQTGLTDDDIAGIRALYGSNVPATPGSGPGPGNPGPTPTPTPTPVPTPKPTPGQADTTPPTLQIKTPGSNIVSTSSASIAISGVASDNVAVASVKWTNSTGDAGVAAGTASWSASVPLLVGTNVITVRAYDAAGNSAWRTVTVVRR